MQFWDRLTGFSREAERRYPPLGGFVSVRGAQIHYLADGPVRGRPVVVLHGASGNLRDWALSLMPRLARTHRVIAFDRPGFGHSSPVPGGERLDVQAALLADALARLGLRRYWLVGHSYSGALALAWALARPAEVAGVAVVAGATMDWGGALAPAYRFCGAPIIGRAMSRIVPAVLPPARIDAALAEVFAPQPVPPRYRDEGGAELALRPHTFRTNFRAVAVLHRQIVAMMAQYPRIACPVEIVHGTEDAIVPAQIHAEGLARILPRARLTLLPGIGHMPHHAAPEAVLAAVGRLTRPAQTPQRQSAGPSAR
ncbi:MAG: alpha/beta hydrolase [Thermohalobaculum sp.]|nr:alpha/beta hydrolase [Thermohalobaculum sp.]